MGSTASRGAECLCGAGRSDFLRFEQHCSDRHPADAIIPCVPVRTAVFDDPNLVSHAGLVPAWPPGGLIDLRPPLTVPGGAGHMAGLKVSALVGGMVTGADFNFQIWPSALRRDGPALPRAPSTLGTFLRSFRFGQVRQLDAVAARFLTALTRHCPLIGTGAEVLRRLSDV